MKKGKFYVIRLGNKYSFEGLLFEDGAKAMEIFKQICDYVPSTIASLDWNHKWIYKESHVPSLECLEIELFDSKEEARKAEDATSELEEIGLLDKNQTIPSQKKILGRKKDEYV